MSRILKYLPELDGEEQLYAARLMKSMSEEEAEQFAHVYRARRRDEMTVLLLTLLGFVGIGGVNRFYVEEIGMGILYVLTAGLCLVGTIVDLVSYKRITYRYNTRQADKAAAMVKGSFA